ncbi:Cleavage and polyadenylation specificity factor subunit 4 [Smittium mucronatum]|uniref:mRNA 3'-end-processing protein n=1 Tax=Smittium mucronatum TaxID=133383 RepID=A0A1R0GQ67_9FUNG|nr:Cleavage and polyadenylation specificity factor subunit 4 [Smittium mucronatum]
MLAQKITLLDPNLAVNLVEFDFEGFVKADLGLNTAYTSLNNEGSGTDQNGSKGSEPTGACNFFLKGHCWKGSNCQYRHISMQEYNLERNSNKPRNYGDRAVVCKHWLRGLCKKGDKCEFLHEYNLTKMPECWFYAKYGECGNSEECVYQHIDPDSRVKECPWYARGFCKNGQHCKRKHARKIMCKNYLFGFCPLGPKCPHTHPSFDLPTVDSIMFKESLPINDPKQLMFKSHGDNQNSQSNALVPQNNFGQQQSGNTFKGFRNLDEIMCFKCNEMGHYANHCPK